MSSKLLSWDEIVSLANTNQVILWRYPRNPAGYTDWCKGTIIHDSGAANPIRIRYEDIDHSFQSEGIWDSQITIGNVEISYEEAGGRRQEAEGKPHK